MKLLIKRFVFFILIAIILVLVIVGSVNSYLRVNADFKINIQKNLKIVDLTGAGDLFAAGFLHGHINKFSIKDCLLKGTEMSSKIIQKLGARLN